MRRKLLKLSLIELGISAVCFIINYFFDHFVTDEGITLTWQPEAGKPFVALLIGIFATLFLFGAVVSALSAAVLFDKESKDKT